MQLWNFNDDDYDDRDDSPKIRNVSKRAGRVKQGTLKRTAEMTALVGITTIWLDSLIRERQRPWQDRIHGNDVAVDLSAKPDGIIVRRAAPQYLTAP